MLFSALLVGASFTDLGIINYLRHSEVFDFINRNSTLLFRNIRYDLPGVYVNNPYKNAVNGSLWTLPYEVKMYGYLFLGGVILEMLSKYSDKHKLFKWSSLTIIVVAFVVYFLI